tara:strand:+ start:304 stop:753 length:450 start_codon:yes stop_codon:yes gene_type:complete
MSVPKITANSTTRLRLVAEIEDTANAGGCSADLSVAAFDYLYELAADEMPYGTQKARDGDPFEWLDENVMPDYVTTNPSQTLSQIEGSFRDTEIRLKLAIEGITANISAFELRSKEEAISETEKAFASGVVGGLRIAEKYMGIVRGGLR